MNFLYETIDILGEVKQINSASGKRIYETPDGNFPSITTVLSSLSKVAIQKWRNRIGEAAANKITSQASRRGTRTHTIIENYLQNKQDYLTGHLPDSIELFQSIQSILDVHIKKIHGLEVSLWSKELGIAGRCDCIAEYDDEISIIDWKTSLKPKKEEWIEKFYLQGTGYAKMFEERTGVKVSKIVIVIAVIDSYPQIYYSDPDVHVDKLKEVINSYNTV